jgi:hypothetical protein
MLSRLYRNAQALDGACLRAWGFPSDHAIREELLSALEWDKSLQLDHVRPSIRLLYVQAQTQSMDLSDHLRSAAGNPNPFSPHLVVGLRETLRALMRLLEATH